MRYFLLTTQLLLAFIAFNQLYVDPTGNSTTNQPAPNQSKAANCAPPTYKTMMEMNNVRALIHTAGNLWQVPGKNYSQYEIPKNSGIMCLFTAALWLGGTDVNNQLKLAALRYRQGQDYWNGPLSKEYAEVDVEDCLKYDKHFVSTRDEVAEFSAWYEAGVNDKKNGTTTQKDLFPNYKIPDIIKNWPAHGDVSKGQDYYLAPFYDNNQDGTYSYADGDYPWYDITRTKNCKTDKRVSLYGDLNYWWVMNDKGNLHTETKADPIGMEIRAQAFSFASNDEINNMTFYNYELINRGTQTLSNTYFGFFTDGALGNPFDDYVGCDVNRGLGYYYNGNNFDGEYSGFKGYGNTPPAVGVDFFEGPYQDADGIDNKFGIGAGEALNGIGYGDGIVDNERYGMRRFLYYSNTTNGANPNQTDPITASDYYYYLRGFWKDGTHFVYGGSGHISDPDADPNVKADFMFPGDTDPLGWGTGGVPQVDWTEQSAGNIPNDKRFLESAGPFVLKPGAVNNITVGVCWARASSGGPFESVKTLKVADDKAQALFENCFKILEGPHAPDLEIQELNNELVMYLSNPLSSNNYKEGYKEYDPFIFSSDTTIDRYYKFQGYQIFQLASNAVTVSDIEDPTKARLVAQCDIEDNYSRIINFEYDDNLAASVPVEKVKGANQGIRHSFKVTEDAFASGVSKLVNHKAYYYMAVAYAVNNYKKYDPKDPLALDGQQKIFISSRKAAIGNVKVITGIPHNPISEANGTTYTYGYGESPLITRLDGLGNGANNLELTDETIQQILATGKVDKPIYEKNNSPFSIQIIDPLNVADGYFELKFRSYAYSTNITDTASWTIYRYTEEGGTLIDSVNSENMINVTNDQLIPQWGISVSIQQEKYVLKNNQADLAYTDLLSSSIYFEDSTQRWLTGIADDGSFFPTNWIRSGIYDAPAKDSNSSLGWQNPYLYPDEVGLDDNKSYSNLLGGLIAPHRLTGYQSAYMPIKYYRVNPASIRLNVLLSALPNVNIVLTQDTSKWTRCPVIELGTDTLLTVGHAAAGQLRKSWSVDKNGNVDNSGTKGLGWFPGYAIDVESGARLYMAFGENSYMQADHGADMIWNPSDRLLDNSGTPIFGGQHAVYLFSYKQKSANSLNNLYDLGAYNESTNEVYQLYKTIETGTFGQATIAGKQLFSSLTWVMNPLVEYGKKVMACDVMIRLRVNKEYRNFTLTGQNNGKPMFSWNMNGSSTVKGNLNALTSVLDIINIVPNPYYAYSEYERNKIEARVRITNLPTTCTIRIYNLSGKQVKVFKKNNELTYVDWDLNNEVGIQLASGVYLIHVSVPNVGDRMIKFFAGMRQVDIQNY